MEIEVLSRECIQPSSPTPFHLKTHKISLLDRYATQGYVPLVLYYGPSTNQEEHSNLSKTDIISKRFQLLKHSLSKVLTFFYPFAGTIKDEFSIDCNDKGVYFVEARMKSGIFLFEFLNQPDLYMINNFLPAETKRSQQPISGAHTTLVQVTTFACGSMVIGVSVHHMLVDGVSLSTFLKSWATIACKSRLKEATLSYKINPNFNGSYLFPLDAIYLEEGTSSARTAAFVKTTRWVYKRFLFDASAIAKLKSKATSSSMKNPTRVEAVSTMLFKCIRSALEASSGFHKSTLLAHTVNLRQKAVPPLSEQSIGNYVWLASTPISRKEEEGERELKDLVYQLRDAIKKIDGNLVKRLQGDEGLVNVKEAINDLCKVYSGVDDVVGFSSWCRFGFYEVDFGWGKPAWASCIVLESLPTPGVNDIILMDTRSGNGIEAWVYLGEEDMANLELNQELLTFASLDPSPLGPRY